MTQSGIAGGRAGNRLLVHLSSTPALLAAVLLMALLIRMSSFGDLVGHADEQFYLLVGDRMLNDGAVPYVDIWDRKPVGLFLLYAAIRALGGDGIVQYQVAATLFAGLSACLIAMWVKRSAGILPALLAALYYLLILQARVGYGGQAEVFINLPIIGAAIIVHDLLIGRDSDPPPASGLLWRGCAAMLLVGLAIQVKPTALFPGLWFGLALLWRAFRDRLPPARLLGSAGLWVGAALVPTLLAIAWYAAAGLIDEYVFANVTSVLQKGSEGEAGEASRRLYDLRRFGALFLAAGALVALQAYRAGDRNMRASAIFLVGWLASSIAAYLAVKNALAHYTLIVAPVGCILIGLAMRVRVIGWVLLLVVGYYSAIIIRNDVGRVAHFKRISPQIAAMADRIKPELGGKCLYVHHGPVLLYQLTESCLPSRFPFPSHLNTAAEATGLGIDTVAEVRRILGRRPPVIVTAPFDFGTPNEATRSLVTQAIARDYEPFASIQKPDGAVIATAYRRKTR